ncbi:MAG: hypothetical protein ABH811_02835 [archaeon]
MKKESWSKISIVTIFAIAMGFLEAVVVIYLRKLYYPNGFNFPLKGFIDPSILSIEWVREFATIVMLITVAMLASKKLYERFAYFIYAFAIWDIFYYLFLKLTLNWPASFFTWDILFLIPWPWVGPVLAPLLCTILMIITTLIIINFKDSKIKIKLREFILVITGLLVVLYTWLYDYGKIIIGRGFTKDFFTLANNPQFYQIIESYSPSYYNWPIFLIGLIISSIGILLFYLRTKK